MDAKIWIEEIDKTTEHLFGRAGDGFVEAGCDEVGPSAQEEVIGFVPFQSDLFGGLLTSLGDDTITVWL